MPTIDCQQFPQIAINVEFFAEATCALVRGKCRELGQRRCPQSRTREGEPFNQVSRDYRVGRDTVGHQNGQPGCLCLNQNKTKPFENRWKHECVHGRQHFGYVVSQSCKRNPSAQFELGHSLLNRGTQLTAPHEQQMERRVSTRSNRKRINQEAVVLLRIEPTDVSDYFSIMRDPEFVPRPGTILLLPKRRVVDATGKDSDTWVERVLLAEHIPGGTIAHGDSLRHGVP